jgi:hypothetical protein
MGSPFFELAFAVEEVLHCGQAWQRYRLELPALRIGLF